jgi:pyruvate dehydrogenase E1 component
MIFVQWLAQLLREKTLGPRVVPIVADEARTFGMQTLFRQVGIYSALGQLYEPEDHDELLFYKEAKDGQILEEGITEAGALSSWLAAATAYSAHAEPMLPFYVYYSIFGFQRVGDLIWAAADSRARGFLLGATAGRTTLSGEGLQHQDGSSHLMAATVPNCRAFDPCFGHELVTLLQDGASRMLEQGEDVFYYLTLANENYEHPAQRPADREGILRGLYRLSGDESSAVQLLGSGPILRQVMRAADMLAADWGITAAVWSVTSFSELRRDGMACERAGLFGDRATAPHSWIEQQLGPTRGPVIAASDYVRAVPDLIRPYLARRYVTLGTDGFGRSDTREALRRFFEISPEHIATAALAALVDEGALPVERLAAVRERYGISGSPPPWTR